MPRVNKWIDLDNLSEIHRVQLDFLKCFLKNNGTEALYTSLLQTLFMKKNNNGQLPLSKPTLVRLAKRVFRRLITLQEYNAPGKPPVSIWPIDSRVSFVLNLGATGKQIFAKNYDPDFRKLILYIVHFRSPFMIKILIFVFSTIFQG